MEKKRLTVYGRCAAPLQSLGGRKAGARRPAGPFEFASQETAEAYAKECNSRTTANVHYFVKEKEPEPGAVERTEHSRTELPAPMRNRRPETRRWKN